jgi:hypothetical protein
VWGNECSADATATAKLKENSDVTPALLQATISFVETTFARS